MIWLDEEFHLDGQEDHTVRLCGEYTHPGSGGDPTSPMVVLRLIIETGSPDEAVTVTMFTHDPSMMRNEEPSSDDIFAKYHHKVVKACKKVQGMDFSELLEWTNRTNPL